MGTVVRHTRVPLRGVIIGWRRARDTAGWGTLDAASPGAAADETPTYEILCDNGTRVGRTSGQCLDLGTPRADEERMDVDWGLTCMQRIWPAPMTVAEEAPALALHSDLGRYFATFRRGRYMANPWLRSLYPEL